MKEFIQLVGEVRYYQQSVVNDTIQSAVWAIEPEGMIISNMATSGASAQALLGTPVEGTFVVSVTLNMVSGQILIGEAKIQAVNSLV